MFRGNRAHLKNNMVYFSARVPVSLNTGAAVYSRAVPNSRFYYLAE